MTRNCKNVCDREGYRFSFLRMSLLELVAVDNIRGQSVIKQVCELQYRR